MSIFEFLNFETARFRRRARRNRLAAIVIQKYVRARLSRDAVRLLKAQEMSLDASSAGWFVMHDFGALGGSMYYVHTMKLNELKWKTPTDIKYPIWEKLYDVASQSYYYYNTRTMVSQWVMPSDYIEIQNKTSTEHENEVEIPHGVLMLRSASIVQRAYRAKLGTFKNCVTIIVVIIV